MGILVDEVNLNGASIECVYINCTTKPIRIAKTYTAYFPNDDDDESTKLYKKAYYIKYSASIYGINMTAIPDSQQTPTNIKGYFIKDEQHGFSTNSLENIIDQVYQDMKQFYPDGLDIE
jgi:hypothetical protein